MESEAVSNAWIQAFEIVDWDDSFPLTNDIFWLEEAPCSDFYFFSRVNGVDSRRDDIFTARLAVQFSEVRPSASQTFKLVGQGRAHDLFSQVASVHKLKTDEFLAKLLIFVWRVIN